MRHATGVLALVLLLGGASCNKSQILPTTIAGVGGATMVGGFIYSATLPEGSGFFGDNAGDSAAIGGLIFGGVALAVTGILFSITSADCDSDDDCWSGDRCELESHSCVAADALPASLPVVESGESAVPAESVEPAEPVVPAEPIEPVEPVAPAESVAPVESVP